MAHLFVPGPVDVDPEVAAQQTKPMLAHRSKEFEAIFHRAAEQSQALFGTQYRVLISASSGTGLQEAAIRNLVKERVLVCVNGAFSKRWYEVGTNNGKTTDRVEAEWGTPIRPEEVEAAVRREKYDLVAVVHNETSTGVQNPVPEIAEAVRRGSPETLIAVDTVSSLGGVNFAMDEWGLDFVLTSSQKALALPPGLSLAAVNDRAMVRAEDVPNRGWYFDILRLEKHRLKDFDPRHSRHQPDLRAGLPDGAHPGGGHPPAGSPPPRPAAAGGGVGAGERLRNVRPGGLPLADGELHYQHPGDGHQRPEQVPGRA